MIKGKEFTLRSIRERDLAQLFSYFDPIVQKGQLFFPDLLTEHRFRLQFFETGFWSEKRGVLVMEAQGDLFGAIWFEKQKLFDGLNLFFHIFDREKAFLAKEALVLFSSYLFEMRKEDRHQIFIPGYQKGMMRLVQRCGFRFEGIARESLFEGGRYWDQCIYSLLRKDKGIT